VKLREIPDDRQSQAQAAEAPCARGVGLLKPIKHVGQEVRPDAGASVCNDDFSLRPGAAQHDSHTPALWGELERVGQQIPHDLLQPRGIAGHRPD
jgi:hypothetical protein